MLYIPLPLPNAFVIDLDKRDDERGFFARAFCRHEFEKRGLEGSFIQMNNSLSKQKGTLRGMHYQIAPYAEVKLMRCIRGAMYDVILDLRPESQTFKHWLPLLPGAKQEPTDQCENQR